MTLRISTASTTSMSLNAGATKTTTTPLFSRGTPSPPAPSMRPPRLRVLGPSRWKTPEFLVYYIIIAILWGALYHKAWLLSQPDHPNAYLFSRYLSPGYMWAGSRMDNSDAQFSGFRNNLPILSLVAPVHLLLSSLVRRLFPSRWTHFSLAFSLIFLTVAHGYHLLKILALLLINFAIAKGTGGSKWNPILTWVWNVGTLFLIEWTRGFKMLNPSPESNIFGGIMRWDVTFNITVLRLISFNLDWYWAHDESASRIIDSHKCSEPPTHPPSGSYSPPHYCCAKLRTQLPHPLASYSLVHYLAYAVYIPLYFAGPILTFNSFLSQTPSFRPARLPLWSTLLYTLRMLLAIVLMDLFMHLFHIPAITRAQAWTNLPPSSLAAIGFLNLKHIWLKLLIIWRFFRTWSLWDALVPPENMRRCVSNNYSTLAFWRDWHASFNLWNVRYLYVPLGGARTRAWNTWVIFTFVAVWHDLKLKLFAWGWLIALFMVPELVGKWVARGWVDQWWYRHVAALGAVGNICMMITGNLVGFALGTEGMWQMLVAMARWEASGAGFVACVFVCLFASVQIMFEVREEEERQMRKRWIEAGGVSEPVVEDRVPLVAVGSASASGKARGSSVRGRPAVVNGVEGY